MPTRIKFSIPYNGDLELTKWAIASGQVYEVYFTGAMGSDYASPCAHPGKPRRTAGTTRPELSRLIKLCAQNGINRNLLINKSLLGFDSLKKILRYLRQLRALDGLTSVTVADRAIIPYIRQAVPDVTIQASVFLHIDSVQKVREAYKMGITEFCLDVSMSRNAPELERIRDWRATRPDIRIKLLANHGCYPYCFYAHEHEDWLALLEIARQVGRKSTVDSLLGRFNYNCMFQPADIADEIRRPFIRPEDVGFYEEHGLADYIKIAYRTDATPVLQRKLQAYFERSYKGELEDIAPPNRPRLTVALWNKSFPAGFIKKVCYCGLQCDTCGYCAEVMGRVAVSSVVGGRLGRKT